MPDVIQADGKKAPKRDKSVKVDVAKRHIHCDVCGLNMPPYDGQMRRVFSGGSLRFRCKDCAAKNYRGKMIPARSMF